jgi:hypothetical protein
MTRLRKILNSYKSKVVKIVKAVKDNVNHPTHYTQGKIECIEAIAEATKQLQGIEAVATANVIKYVWRWKSKNGIEDLQKAQWYLNHLIKQIQK